jgi:hypothetical protein
MSGRQGEIICLLVNIVICVLQRDTRLSLLGMSELNWIRRLLDR